MEENTTKISFESEHGKYTIEVKKTDMSITETFEDLIEPILLVSGYQQANIDALLGNNSEEALDIMWNKAIRFSSDVVRCNIKPHDGYAGVQVRSLLENAIKKV